MVEDEAMITYRLVLKLLSVINGHHHCQVIIRHLLLVIGDHPSPIGNLIESIIHLSFIIACCIIELE